MPDQSAPEPPSVPWPLGIDEAMVLQFDQALREHGGSIQAVGATMAESAHPSRIVAIDPASGGVIVTGHRDGGDVLYIDGVGVVSRDTTNAWARSLAERMRPAMEAMRAQFEALCVHLRPLVEVMAELHEQYPDPADWVIEPEPEGCHHLCGRTPLHECLGEADGTFAYREGAHEIPMCAPCRDAAASRGFEDVVDAVNERADERPEAWRARRETGIDWGDPIEAADADWPARGAVNEVCAHVCGPDPDHECGARADTFLQYPLPSGGTRSMPICEPCFTSETAAKEGAHA